MPTHFADNYSIHDHGRMVNERKRMDAFVGALEQAVRPGSVVLDIGTGSGVFAILACRLGAARVYALEPDPIIDVAMLCASNNEIGNKIIWTQGLSTQIDLPERVDVVIGDLHGTLPFYNSNIDSMRDARRRHLKPNGRMIPARDVLRAAPAHAPLEYRNVSSPWLANDLGINMSAGHVFVTNQWWRARPQAIDAGNFLAAPATWGVIDYLTVDKLGLEGSLSWCIESAGTMHGFYIWFDSEVADGLTLSNAPDVDELVYGRAFFPLAEAVDVLVGDVLHARIVATRVGSDDIYRWDTQVTSAAGEDKARFSQSTFKSRPIRRTQLAKLAAEHVPSLGEAGAIDRDILDAMTGALTLQQIATHIAARYPKHFPDEASALSHVGKVSAKYAI